MRYELIRVNQKNNTLQAIRIGLNNTLTVSKKEEHILFPRIKELHKLVNQENSNLQISIGYLQSPITIMEQEHDHAGSMLYEIRILSNNYNPPADACTTYRLSFAALQAFELDLHQHVHLENNILFPKAISTFKELQGLVLN